MAENIHKVVWDWLQGCPYVHDLYFAFARADPGDTIVLPVTAYSHTVLQEFTGAKEIRYSFSLIHYAMLSDDPNSADNIDTLLDVEQLAAWVEAQDTAQDFPKLDGATVTAVGVLESDAGHFATQDSGSAKYMFQFYIDYLKEE